VQLWKLAYRTPRVARLLSLGQVWTVYTKL
jgi:hypothetical protein